MAKVREKKVDVYQVITDRILSLLEEGVVPWHKPWRGGVKGRPSNATSRKAYRGVNVFLLAVTQHLEGYETPYWLTYKQAKELGGHVRKGEKSTPVIFWNWLERKTDAGEPVLDPLTRQPVKIPFLKYYRVFNVAQCADLDLAKLPPLNEEGGEDLDFDPVTECEAIVGNYRDCPPIYHDGGKRAYYRPSADEVHLPFRERFGSIPEYYNTLFHELGHSTSHASRLDRLKSDRQAAFGSDSYGREELVAEMTAAMLSGVCGIEGATIENSAAYIDGWRKAIKKDRKLVIVAAGQAQKAADYICQ